MGWTDLWPTDSLPGADDDVEFRPENDRSCILDQDVTLHSVKVLSGYTSTIKLWGNLTIDGAGSFFHMGGSGSVAGYVSPQGQITHATLTLYSPASFTWSAGTFSDLTIGIGRASATSFATAVISAPATVLQMRSVDLHVDGKLTWSGQEVRVNAPATGQPRSSVVIGTQGVFDITGNGAQWGDPGGNPALLSVVNLGTTTLNLNNSTPTPTTIVGDFTNHGTVNLNVGVLALKGKAEQGGGTFALHDNTTVWISRTEVLGIRNGSITGQGTIDGNLVLGNADGTGSPTISPGGVFGGVGTLTVTLSFDIWSAQATTLIEVEADGNFDKIVVNTGYAALNGTLHIDADAAYKPAAGTRLSFLTAGGGVQRDFSRVSVPNLFWADPNTGQQVHWGWGKTANSYDLIATAVPVQPPPSPPPPPPPPPGPPPPP